jgi:formamidase
VRLSLEPDRPLREQPERGHNRWHPDLAPAVTVAPGTELTLELRDSMDGQVTADSTHEDLLSLSPLSHVLTGPVEIEGAAPGDVLELEIVGYETAEFGWTAVIPGAGLLGDLVERPYLVRWDLAGGAARSEELPGVTVPACIHAGVIGVAPSGALFEEALRRERALAADLHFSQGDGEVCLYAIETSGSVTLRAGLRAPDAWSPRFPAYEAPPRPPRSVFATTGIPLTDAGESVYMDLNVAGRRALLELIGWLRAERGLSFEQAYALASVAAELRISEAVDLPNVLVSAALPLDVLEGWN